MKYIYPVILTEDKDDGGYVVTCRDLPEAITQGDTIEEALEASITVEIFPNRQRNRPVSIWHRCRSPLR